MEDVQLSFAEEALRTISKKAIERKTGARGLRSIMEGTVASVHPQGGRKNPQQEFLQVETTNILFVCGGAFAGLEKIISARGRSTSIGFGAKVETVDERRTGDILRGIEPEDLLKFGLIPEFIGRVPVIATLDDLDEEALIRILTEPKNALVRQYQRLFEMEDVQLSFAEEALRTISKKAIERKTGARGLRSIMEGRHGPCASTPNGMRKSAPAPDFKAVSHSFLKTAANPTQIRAFAPYPRVGLRPLDGSPAGRHFQVQASQLDAVPSGAFAGRMRAKGGPWGRRAETVASRNGTRSAQKTKKATAPQ
jgi:hypothetical protein